MGSTQTKLHWAVLQGDWEKTLQCLQKVKYNATIANPYGDYPLHLACYSGKAPPEVIQKLIKACPDAVMMKNKKGYYPLKLAEINYRSDDPNRERVLAMLRTFVDAKLCAKYCDETDTEESIDSNSIPPLFVGKWYGNNII
ncbi:hypothetical protein ACHAWT_007032 [Skeletonema menzelii]